jgi:hypothetical protein
MESNNRLSNKMRKIFLKGMDPIMNKSFRSKQKIKLTKTQLPLSLITSKNFQESEDDYNDEH